jgi:hypothetical protein
LRTRRLRARRHRGERDGDDPEHHEGNDSLHDHASPGLTAARRQRCP